MRRLRCSNCEDALNVPFCYGCSTSEYIEIVETDSKEEDIEYVLTNLNKATTTVYWSVMFEYPAIINQSKMTKLQIKNMLQTTDFIINHNEHVITDDNMVVPVIGVSFTTVEIEDDDDMEDIAYSAYIEIQNK